MPKTVDEPDLFDVLEEIEKGPLPCPHPWNKDGWVMEMRPRSPYYLEWVHAHPNCRRSTKPGANKGNAPTMGWNRKLQKDVPL